MSAYCLKLSWLAILFFALTVTGDAASIRVPEDKATIQLAMNSALPNDTILAGGPPGP